MCSHIYIWPSFPALYLTLEPRISFKFETTERFMCHSSLSYCKMHYWIIFLSMEIITILILSLNAEPASVTRKAKTTDHHQLMITQFFFFF